MRGSQGAVRRARARAHTSLRRSRWMAVGVMTATRVRVRAGAVVCLGLVVVPPRNTLGAGSPLRMTKVGKIVGVGRVGWRGSPVRGTGSDLSRRARLTPARMQAGWWYKTRSRMLTSRQDASSAGELLWSTLHYRLSTWGCVSKCRRSFGLSMSGPSSMFFVVLRRWLYETDWES
jgi:hypothetical protein